MVSSRQWDQADFVKRVLRTAAKCGEKSVNVIRGGLFAATTSGGRNGRPGQPFPEDMSSGIVQPNLQEPYLQDLSKQTSIVRSRSLR